MPNTADSMPMPELPPSMTSFSHLGSPPPTGYSHGEYGNPAPSRAYSPLGSDIAIKHNVAPYGYGYIDPDSGDSSSPGVLTPDDSVSSVQHSSPWYPGNEVVISSGGPPGWVPSDTASCHRRHPRLPSPPLSPNSSFATGSEVPYSRESTPQPTGYVNWNETLVPKLTEDLKQNLQAGIGAISFDTPEGHIVRMQHDLQRLRSVISQGPYGDVAVATRPANSESATSSDVHAHVRTESSLDELGSEWEKLYVKSELQRIKIESLENDKKSLEAALRRNLEADASLRLSSWRQAADGSKLLKAGSGSEESDRQPLLNGRTPSSVAGSSCSGRSVW